MNGIKIKVVFGDAFNESGDVLGLKYAQGSFGLDESVVMRFEYEGYKIKNRLPDVWDSYYTTSYGLLETQNILFVGVPDLGKFQYKEIREFGRRLLSTLSIKNPSTKKLNVTVHGVGYGLDELEAFESQIAGFIDSISIGDYPESLEEIVFIENIESRVARLNSLLRKLFPDGIIHIKETGGINPLRNEPAEILRSAGYESNSKLKVFVAMPFAQEFDDIFYYGIQGAVKSAGYLCERADMVSYTGDIMNWIKKSIENSEYLIADLTNASANVYLEVGYAWGSDTKTILLVQDTKHLKFDVKGQRCIVYKSIKGLEESLTKELESLKIK